MRRLARALVNSSQVGDNPTVYVGPLADIEGRHVEAESLGTPQQPIQCEQPRVQPPIGAQTRCDQLEIGDELVRRFIGKCLVVVGRAQTRFNQPEKDAVWHLAMPRWHSVRCLLKVRGVEIDPGSQLTGNVDA